jgi:hypothetical protein
VINNSEDKPSEASSLTSEEAVQDDIDEALHELRMVTHRVRMNANLVTAITLTHIAYSIFSIVYTAMASDTSRYSAYYVFRPGFIAAEIILLVTIIMALLRFDRAISRGETLYQEVSDELEWHISVTRKKTPVKESRFMKDRPGLQVRLLLREFVSSSRLPLVRGDLGVAYYLTLNVLLTFVSLLTIALKTGTQATRF